MFSGTLIDELMAVVAQAEEQAEAELHAVDGSYCLLVPECSGETILAGVA